jgi:hypothetical protein
MQTGFFTVEARHNFRRKMNKRLFQSTIPIRRQFFARRSFFYLNEVTEGNVGEHILSRLRRATVD